jgi:serine/threonine protein kinase
MVVAFNHYTIHTDQKIDEGSRGIVVRASTPRGSRVVAKISWGSSLEPEPGILRLVSQLKIPHVAALLHSGKMGDRDVMILQRAYSDPYRNQSLDVDRLITIKGIRAFSFQQIISCAKQVFEVVEANEILNRDIKCSNLIWNYKEGLVKVVDWGWGCRKSDHTNYDRQGTSHILPPEVLLKQEKIRYLVDVWEIGIALFTMLTGRAPFGKVKDRDVVLKTILASIGNPSKEYLKTCSYREEIFLSTGEQFKRDWKAMVKEAVRERSLHEGGDPEKLCELFTDLLGEIFQYDDRRITAKKALMHPLFASDMHVKVDCKGLPEGCTLAIAGLEIPLSSDTNCIHLPKKPDDQYPMSIVNRDKRSLYIGKNTFQLGSSLHIALDESSKIIVKAIGPANLKEVSEEKLDDDAPPPSAAPALSRLQGTCFI